MSSFTLNVELQASWTAAICDMNIDGVTMLTAHRRWMLVLVVALGTLCGCTRNNEVPPARQTAVGDQSVKDAPNPVSSERLPPAPFTTEALRRINLEFERLASDLDAEAAPLIPGSPEAFGLAVKYYGRSYAASGYSFDLTLREYIKNYQRTKQVSVPMGVFIGGGGLGMAIDGLEKGPKFRDAILGTGYVANETLALFDSPEDSLESERTETTMVDSPIDGEEAYSAIVGDDEVEVSEEELATAPDCEPEDWDSSNPRCVLAENGAEDEPETN